MSLEKAAKEAKKSSNSIYSLYLLLSSVEGVAKEYKDANHASFSSSIYSLQDIFLNANSTDVSVMNVLNYVVGRGTTTQSSREDVLARVGLVKNYLKAAQKKISLFGEQKIIDGGDVFVFGCDPLITGILKHARSNGKKFKIHNTEMRPGFHGRKLAGELSRGGIKVTHYTDNSIKKAMDGVDVVFSDCNYILPQGGVVGTSGLDLVADIALNFGTPLYVCAPSWKLNPSTLVGGGSGGHVGQIWKGAPKGIKINDIPFDTIGSEFVTGVISELGIYPTHTFIEEAKYENMWKF